MRHRKGREETMAKAETKRAVGTMTQRKREDAKPGPGNASLRAPSPPTARRTRVRR